MEIKREPPKVCPRTAKRCQIEQLYTLVEVEVVVDQRVDEMVEKLKDKLEVIGMNSLIKHYRSLESGWLSF